MKTLNLKHLTFLVIMSGMLFISCKKDDLQPEDTKNETPQPAKAKVPVSGHYLWEFEIPGIGNQESHLTFYTDSVQYIMTGPAYNTNYMMIQESYSEANDQKRWIGIGKGGSISKDGVYFVMFFKDITDNSVTIYKHECDGGREEAESFPYPDPDATADHGWNVYYKK